MKANIHPTYYPDAKIICACGNVILTGSTKPQIKVEICSHCHPFFTGAKKFIDRMGRIERFQAKQQGAKGYQPKKKDTNLEDKNPPKTLKEMLLGL